MNEPISLFNGRAGEDTVQVRLEPRGAGLVLSTQEWGEGIELNFGFDTIETWLSVGADSVAGLATSLRTSHSTKDADDLTTVVDWLMGDSAASAHLRSRLDELGLPYEFQMR